MDAPALIAALQEDVPGASLEAAASADLHTTIYASPGDLPAIARALRDRPDLRCVFLAELTAVDLHPREPRFELVYMLVSLEHRFRLRVKVRLDGNAAHVQTVIGVWPAANWLEREVWDLFGIAFAGHPDPRVPTVSDLWPAANWLEREVWDLFGIAFQGHPDPRRLLMPEDWEGYPLRKDYPVQIRQTPRTSEALQVTEEEFRANVLKDRLSR